MKGRKPWNKGKKFPGKWRHKKKSASTKRKIRRAKLGKKTSDKTKRKQSKAHKGKHEGKLNPQYGKHQSKKTPISTYTNPKKCSVEKIPNEK